VSLRPITLIGDGIENPGNALAMIHAARMFGVGCAFRDTKGLARLAELNGPGSALQSTTTAEIRAEHSQIIACDNLPGAAQVYGYRPGKEFAVLVGNERRGLSHELRGLASESVEIPMRSRRVNCLNVAAASAVALYYLCGPQVRPMVARADPASRRPELLLVGGQDHVELGSAIRSAAAFGWGRALIDDRRRVWFGCDRVTRSEGRAAARRGKNDIRLVPLSADRSYTFPEVTVITTARLGDPLPRANLARGSRHLVVIPDEHEVDVAREGWTRLGRDVRFAHLALPRAEYTYHYRLTATVALAEISRQVGVPLSGPLGRPARPPFYDRALEALASEVGEVVSLWDLLDY
jgi:tRNA G18 (ribose-2'-O)-methylase SpoU